ncbi:MAG: GDP-mannose 4,6-dehydratase, partial [Proteobacteria bacterium]|nr:GDP-mannose 4,6-dehydratase [Pseudomonadota bacterium]
SCGDDVAITYLPHKSEDGTIGPGPKELENKYPIPIVVQTLGLDITNRKAVFDVITLLKPDVVYHLAAMAYVPDGEIAGQQLFSINTFGTMNVLDAIAECSTESRFLFISSAEVYGEPKPGGLPLTEASELRPISAYGVSKVTADLMAYKYFYRNGIHTVRMRPFPHIGPGQSESFAISGFAKQVANIKLGKSKPVINVGNLEVKRDYTDVNDVVRCYREAILNGKPGEAYNVCTGESFKIGDVLQMILKRAGVEADVVVDQNRVRLVDISDLYGSYQKAQKDFGWKPRVEREASLDSLLAYWLEQLG